MNREVTFLGSSPAEDEIRLQSVIAFYGQSRIAGVGSTLAMLHNADVSGELGPGQPIDPVELATTIHRLKAGEAEDKLVITEPCVLAETKDAILWWRPATDQPMWFKTAEPVPELTALNGVPLHHPPLVFRASKKRPGLSVFALKSNERPTADTTVYVAPYMNQYSNGHGVCLGTSSGKIDPKTARPKDWEVFFFDSNFSHTPPRLHHVKTSNPNSTDEKRQTLAAYGAFLQTLRTRAGSEAAFDRSLVRIGPLRTVINVSS